MSLTNSLLPVLPAVTDTTAYNVVLQPASNTRTNALYIAPSLTFTPATSSLTSTGNITAAGFFYSNGTPVSGGAGTTTDYYGFKNRIINGSTLINQRGVTSGVTSGYFVDRWQVSGLTTSSLITTSLPNNFTQAISLNRTSAAGTMTTYQNIESKNCLDLVGATVTVSFWAQNVTGITSITATLNYANTVDTFSAVTAITTVTVSSSPSASWTYYTATYTNLPSGVANGLQLVIAGVTASTGTLGVTGVQLEKGSTATSFDYRPYGTELQLCQRYYIKYGPLVSGYNKVGSGYISSSTNGVIAFAGPSMRSSPTVSYLSAQISDGSVNNTITSVSSANALGCGISVELTGSGGGLTLGRGAVVRLDASGFVDMSAEL